MSVGASASKVVGASASKAVGVSTSQIVEESALSVPNPAQSESNTVGGDDDDVSDDDDFDIFDLQQRMIQLQNKIKTVKAMKKRKSNWLDNVVAAPAFKVHCGGALTKICRNPDCGREFVTFELNKDKNVLCETCWTMRDNELMTLSSKTGAKKTKSKTSKSKTTKSKTNKSKTTKSKTTKSKTTKCPSTPVPKTKDEVERTTPPPPPVRKKKPKYKVYDV